MTDTAGAHPALVDRDGCEWVWFDGGYHATNAPCTRTMVEELWGPVTEKPPPPAREGPLPAACMTLREFLADTEKQLNVTTISERDPQELGHEWWCGTQWVLDRLRNVVHDKAGRA